MTETLRRYPTAYINSSAHTYTWRLDYQISLLRSTTNTNNFIKMHTYIITKHLRTNIHTYIHTYSQWWFTLSTYSYLHYSTIEYESTWGNFSVQPARMVPPYTIRAGRFSRPMAIKQPGIFLSQPGIATRASYHCPPIVVSMESTHDNTKDYNDINTRRTEHTYIHT